MMATVDILRMLQEAENARMRSLLDSWQKEIDAAAEAAVEAAAHNARYEGARAAELHAAQLADQNQRDLAAQDARDLATRAGLENYLYGVLLQALAGYDVSVSLPEGVSVASSLIVAANDAELSALLAEVEEAEDGGARAAQKSAVWAVQNGYVPHPNDLSTLARSFESDSAWADHFGSLGSQLDALTLAAKSPAMLQAKVGGNRLDVVSATVSALDRYGASRMLALLGRPKAGPTTPAPSVPNAAATKAPIDSILRGVFG